MHRKTAEATRHVVLLAAGALAALACAGAVARTSDRNQPLDVAAAGSDCFVGDDGPCTLTGNVHLTQGSLNVRGGKATLHRTGGDVRRVVLTGAPVQLSQELDDGSRIDARASNVDYDLTTDTVVFTGNAVIDQPGKGNIAGGRIAYNMRSGQVQGTGEGQGQVKMRFLPKQGTR